MNVNILIIAIVGFSATMAMVVFMGTITRMHVADANMVKAIGSLFTHEEETALYPGLLLHFTAGIIFAFLYTSFLEVFPFQSIVGFAFMGTAMGFFHGMIVSFIIVMYVARHHPIERFRDFGFVVAAAHVVGHIIYGFIIGVAVYALDLQAVLPVHELI